MKRVLVITYYWPPSGGSGVQRWVKFAKYLLGEGWQCVVCTPENPDLIAEDSTLGAEIPPEVEVLRRPIAEPYELYRRLLGRKKGQAVTPISSGSKSFKERLSLYIRGNFFVPDPRVWWVRPTARFLKKYLREHPVDVIVTTGPPQSMHLIGQSLAKATGIPWIPDFRDPWTKMYYLKHLPLTKRTWRRLEKMEQSVIDDASAVLTVTPLVQEFYAAKTKTPVEMITNGFDEEDFADEPVSGVCLKSTTSAGQDGSLKSTTSAGPDFNITHTGLFAKDGNPLELWKVLGAMAAEDPEFKAKLRLRLAGKTDPEVLQAIAEAGLAQNVVDLGYCVHADAVREQKSATVLILPLRHDPDYRIILPGKLFEYLASRRPMLGIGQVDGAMARVVSDCAAGKVCDWDDAEGMRRFLDEAWGAFKAGGVKPTAGDVSAFTRRATAHSLAALLDKVSRK